MKENIIRVFVGCDPNDCDLEQMMVLDYTLRKHASLPVDIHWMQLSRDPQSFWYSNPERDQGWRTERWATPFSGFRWAIPAFCGYQGRAIYMDTDMIVLSDLAELWSQPMEPEAVVIAKREKNFQRYCVMLWDCGRAKAVLPDIEALRRRPQAHADMQKYFSKRPKRVQRLDPAFNSIDGEGQPIERIKLLHYSDMGTQFSHKYALPRLAREGRSHWFDGEVLPHPRQDLAELFDRCYAEALQHGYSPERYRVQAPFGTLVKKSEKAYAGNAVTRRPRWSLAAALGWK